MNLIWSTHSTPNGRFELRCDTEFEWEGKLIPIKAGEWYDPNIQNPESLKQGILASMEKQITWWKTQQIKAGGESLNNVATQS